MFVVVLNSKRKVEEFLKIKEKVPFQCFCTVCITTRGSMPSSVVLYFLSLPSTQRMLVLLGMFLVNVMVQEDLDHLDHICYITQN